MRGHVARRAPIPAMTKRKPKQKKAAPAEKAPSPLLLRLVPGAPPPPQQAQPAPDRAHASLLSLLPQLTLTSEQLTATFALPDKLHAFKAADVWWADNVMRQFEGTDVLQPDAHETLREWYNEHARPHYKDKRKAAKAKRAKKKQDVIEAEQPEKKDLH